MKVHGTQFDPAVVDAFAAAHDQIQRFSSERMDLPEWRLSFDFAYQDKCLRRL
jgi:hypothetical protein